MADKPRFSTNYSHCKYVILIFSTDGPDTAKRKMPNAKVSSERSPLLESAGKEQDGRQDADEALHVELIGEELID